MKNRPTTRFIREQIAQNGEVILLLGVRSAESQSRSTNMAKHAAKSVDDRLSPHADLQGCFVFSPIKVSRRMKSGSCCCKAVRREAAPITTS